MLSWTLCESRYITLVVAGCSDQDDHSYFPNDDQPIAFPVVAGILHISTDYRVQELRHRAIARLSRALPTVFDESNVGATAQATF